MSGNLEEVKKHTRRRAVFSRNSSVVLLPLIIIIQGRRSGNRALATARDGGKSHRAVAKAEEVSRVHCRKER